MVEAKQDAVEDTARRGAAGRRGEETTGAFGGEVQALRDEKGEPLLGVLFRESEFEPTMRCMSFPFLFPKLCGENGPSPPLDVRRKGFTLAEISC